MKRAAVVVAVLLGVLIVVWSFQRRLIYLPDNDVPDVGSVRSGAEEVTLTTNDGLSLAAWWIEAGPTAVIFFHGNAGHRGDRAELASGLAERGLSVLLTDYRGYGGNPGSPSQEGLMLDARAALDFVREQQGVQDVVYFGESLGAAVAVQLAHAEPPDALVLRSPFTSVGDVARTLIPFVPDFVVRDRWDSLALAPFLSAATLVIAGDRDGQVPVDMSQDLAAAMADGAETMIVAGAGHNDPVLAHGAEVLDRVAAFIASRAG